MKNSKTLFWIFTGLFSAFMIFTAIPNIMMVPDSVTFMNHLGYPDYFIPFIGFAKIVGSIAILIPKYPTIREWAYAGLTFDLIGAVYSVIAIDGLNIGLTFMVLPFLFLTLSYLYNKKRSETLVTI